MRLQAASRSSRFEFAVGRRLRALSRGAPAAAAAGAGARPLWCRRGFCLAWCHARLPADCTICATISPSHDQPVRRNAASRCAAHRQRRCPDRQPHATRVAAAPSRRRALAPPQAAACRSARRSPGGCGRAHGAAAPAGSPRVMPSSVQASSASQPSMSRRMITARWPAGSRSTASITWSHNCRPPTIRSGSSSSHRRGASIQWPSGLNSDASTARPPGWCPFHQGGQADQPAFARGPGARAVQHDAEHPGDQRGATLEAADAGEHRQPGVLHHLLGLRAAADDRGGDADQRAMEAPDQRSIGAFFATAQPGQEVRLVELGLTHGGLPPERWRWQDVRRVFRNVSPSVEFDDPAALQ